MNSTCDIIIPVYNQPHWLAICLEELFANTPEDTIGRVLIVDDRSNEGTQAAIQHLAGEYPKVTVLRSAQRAGFAASVNLAFAESQAPYLLLLNTDCLLSSSAVPKLIAHCDADPSIGLISPFSNNSEPLSLSMFHGYSYQRMNQLMGSLLAGQNADACTIVGNALLITLACRRATGAFSTEYGLGYGEETEYHFRAIASGFRAVAALDTYVYHRGGESFGSAAEMNALRQRNHAFFFEKWGSAFADYAKRVSPEGPRRQLLATLEKAPLSPCPADVMYVLPRLDQTVGGCHVVVDICNAAARRGLSVQLACLSQHSSSNWKEPLFFEPIHFSSEREFIVDHHFRPANIVATLWNTVFPCSILARSLNVPCHYFVQGYEFYFEAGRVYRAVEDSFQLVDNVFTTSHWLKEMLDTHYQRPISVLPAGYDPQIFNVHGRKRMHLPRILVSLRGSVDKGQPFLMDVIHRLGNFRDQVLLSVLTRESIDLPSVWAERCQVHNLPLTKTALAAVLKDADILVDASSHEGFGLTPLEALACGCTVVVSDSGGVRDFVKNGVNGLVIPEVNRPDLYVERIKELLADRSRLASMQQCAPSTVAAFSADKVFTRYCQYMQSFDSAGPPRQPLLSGERRWIGLIAQQLLNTSSANTRCTSIGLGTLNAAMDSRLSKLESEIAAIYNSRIWRTLCALGSPFIHGSKIFFWRSH